MPSFRAETVRIRRNPWNKFHGLDMTIAIQLLIASVSRVWANEFENPIPCLVRC